MEQIELVIKLPKKELEFIREFGIKDVHDIEGIIYNGTPLPKGHGDLKDVSKINYQQGCFVDSTGSPLPIIHKIATIEMVRDWLPTLIEADKEGEGE